MPGARPGDDPLAQAVLTEMTTSKAEKSNSSNAIGISGRNAMWLRRTSGMRWMKEVTTLAARSAGSVFRASYTAV